MSNTSPTLPLAAGINTFRIVGQTNNSDMIKKLVPLAGTGEGKGGRFTGPQAVSAGR